MQSLLGAEGTLLAAVSQVGFPIVAFLLMYRFAKNTVRENTKAIQELREQLIQMHNNDND